MPRLTHSSPARFLNIFAYGYHLLATLLEGTKQPSTIASLDGVRAVACLSVIVFHISLITTRDTVLWSPLNAPALISAIALAGDTGVTLFFLLSGFLLFLPYGKALLFDAPWPSARVFYLRRMLRILPAYYVSLFLMIFLYAPQYLQVSHLKQLLFFVTLFMDSSVDTFKAINGPFWSLAVEWQFYLILPLLALLMRPLVCRGLLTRRIIVLCCCLLALVGFGVGTRLIGLYITGHPEATLYLPASVRNVWLFFTYGVVEPDNLHGKFLEDFAVGMAASATYVLVRSASSDRIKSVLRVVSPWCLLLGVGSLVFFFAWKHNIADAHSFPFFDSWTDYPLWSELCFSLGYGICVLSILFGPQRLNATFSWQPLRWLGLLSFGIYMWHLKLLEFFTSYVQPLLTTWDHPILYGMYWGWFFVFIAPCALLLYLLVEKPCMNLGDKVRTWLTPVKKETPQKAPVEEVQSELPTNIAH